MGAYGTPEHIPQGEKGTVKKGIIHGDLKTWQKVLLILYLCAVCLLELIMLLTITTYTGNMAIGIISAIAFFALACLFSVRVNAHKNAWPLIICSLAAFFVYFGAMGPSETASQQTVSAGSPTEVADSSQADSSSTPSKAESVQQVESEVPSTPPVEDDTLAVDYKVLYKDYDNNPINADSKYKDKKIKINGAIADIGRDIGQSPYITFNVDEYGAQSIKMSFDNDETVAALKKGQKVTVSGTCNGLFGNVIVDLSNCEIVK